MAWHRWTNRVTITTTIFLFTSLLLFLLITKAPNPIYYITSYSTNNAYQVFLTNNTVTTEQNPVLDQTNKTYSLGFPYKTEFSSQYENQQENGTSELVEENNRNKNQYGISENGTSELVQENNINEHQHQIGENGTSKDNKSSTLSEDMKGNSMENRSISDSQIYPPSNASQENKKDEKNNTFSVDGVNDGSSVFINGTSLEKNSNRSVENPNRKNDDMSKCDIYSGKWVKDGSYPQYPAGSCPYVDEAFDCQRNGRADSDYMNWRWQPHGCQLPRFNATSFLELLRGKKLMLVGDSVNRNQFESMLCLLREGLGDKNRMREVHGYRITKGRGYYVFKFLDYDCTIEFCRTHFLVREGKKERPNGKSRPTLMLDKMDKNVQKWRNADILIFNTGHWWNHGKTAKGKDYFQEGDVVIEKMDVSTAFRKAMMTWAKWVDESIDPAKTLVFFRSYSPAHYRGGQWNSGGTCMRETQPIVNELFVGDYLDKMRIEEDVIRQMRTPVKVLNISRMSYFRKDGHPSVYGKLYASEDERKRSRIQDCSHWCLPGVPDAWNELIYASLHMRRFSKQM